MTQHSEALPVRHPSKRRRVATTLLAGPGPRPFGVEFAGPGKYWVQDFGY